MEEKEQDKSEQPTPFKLMKAREKGVVARGTDLGFFTGLSAMYGFAWIAGPHLGGTIAEAVRGALIGGPSLADGNGAILSLAGLLFTPVVRLIALMAGAVFLVVGLFEIVQTGFVFSTKPLTPDLSKLNPANGLKRVFSLRLLIETFKNVLKLAVYTTIGFLILRAALQSDIGLITDGPSLTAVMTRVTLRLISAFVLGALFFAVLDQIIVRRDFLKRMRMSRRELRRESRDREGEPRLKQKRKQLHREFSKASQSLRNLRKADVLITNPDHLALGLHYDAKSMHAPTIVAMGAGFFAQRLKRLAFVYNIPIIENRALARELHRKGALNGPIPEHCFQPVADIYNAIHRKSRSQDTEPPDA